METILILVFMCLVPNEGVSVHSQQVATYATASECRAAATVVEGRHDINPKKSDAWLPDTVEILGICVPAPIEEKRK